MRITYAEEEAIRDKMLAMTDEDLFEKATSDVDEHDENFERHCLEVDIAREELKRRMQEKDDLILKASMKAFELIGAAQTQGCGYLILYQISEELRIAMNKLMRIK